MSQVDLALLQQGDSAEEPSAEENHFELVQKKLKGIAVGSFGTLQIPISFKARCLEESNGEVQVCMDGTSVSSMASTEPLLWHYPIKVSFVSMPWLLPGQVGFTHCFGKLKADCVK